MKNVFSTTNKQHISIYKVVFSVLLFIFLNPAFSQDNRTYIGVNFYPTSANQLTATSSPNLLRFSYDFGLNIRQELTHRKLYLETGLKTINRGYGYTVDVLNLQGKKFGEYHYQIHKKYVSLPLLVGAKLNSFYFELGPSIDYLYADQIFNKGKWTTSTESDTPFNFSGNLSFGALIEPKTSRRLLFNIGAYANITLFKQYVNAGLKIGVKYRVKKKRKVERFKKN